MTNIHDEREAATEAQTVLRSLVPSAPHTQAQIDALRKAADIATEATNTFESDTALNNKRGEAATALRGVSGSLANGRPLTHEMIGRAKDAVEAWLNGLAEAT